ncbi:MAG: bifunctional (p)ppGpp synthetase/guanosine-3',5'-bis(diphosphate) 3'-pyrophosphohydrolase [Cyanobacteria bacterium P01_D01_bin.123]
MSPLTVVKNTIAVELPDWLQACWDSPAGEEIVSPSRTYASKDVDLIRRAFAFGYNLHVDQTRKSGEPYIIHPIQVAGLLWDLGSDAAMVAAGFLHDVVEDTEVTPEELEAEFGAEVRELVEGVTKLSKFNFSSKTEQQAENFRRMFLAMAQDIRVIVVKLADRLHNMRTLEHLSVDKQRRIADETRAIFAPLANRLGIWHFKWELEDLAFKYLESEAYQHIRDLISTKRAQREAQIETFIDILLRQIVTEGVDNAEIRGRPKHLYSIYQKMRRQKKEFHEIYDLAAVRIIVTDKADCYRALATVHSHFRPIPGRFKDYIGLPKPNRYQSLHTSVIGPQGRPVEVQIRTWEMHHVAEYGIAAHWKYKEVGASAPAQGEDEKFIWLRQLLEWQGDVKDAREYLDNVRENLFESEVYVFTPKGDLFAMPQGSCPVDFAYRIHTEVGNHCAGALVNGKMVTLDTPLGNGDIVEIVTQKNAHPSLDWVNFVATASARNRIRQWYKRSHREQNITRGRQLLERQLGKAGLEALLKSERMLKVAERFNYPCTEDLLAGIGHGENSVTSVVNKLQEHTKPASPALPTFSEPPAAAKIANSTSPIQGVEGLLHHLAGCCNPLPGDPIIGVVTTRNQRGISIHRQDCANVRRIPGDRLLPVSWNKNGQPGRAPTYPVDLQLEVIDRVGVLRDILTRLSDSQINVRNAQVTTLPNYTATIDLRVDITDKDQLDRTAGQLRQLTDVLALKCVRHCPTSFGKWVKTRDRDAMQQ